jgi:hypothetical protein
MIGNLPGLIIANVLTYVERQQAMKQFEEVMDGGGGGGVACPFRMVTWR